jgi:hypothetical protein
MRWDLLMRGSVQRPAANENAAGEDSDNKRRQGFFFLFTCVQCEEGNGGGTVE